MPKTKLDTRIQKWRTSEIKRKINAALTRKKKAAKKKISLSTSDWKKFCDICFEFYIRFRDNWIDGLDGKIYQPGNYEHYHACHYIPRGSLATRYIDINCHGQSSGHNFAMSSTAPTNIRRAMERIYRAFMVKKYGEETVKQLESLETQICHRSLYDWQILAAELFGQAAAMDSIRLQERLDKVYQWSNGKRTLELIQKTLAGDKNE